MENLCFDMKDLYHRILIGLLSLKFSNDYFKRNEDIQNIVKKFLDLQSVDLNISKKELLKELENVSLGCFSDEEILRDAQYKAVEYIPYLFTKHNTLFNHLSLDDKRVLILVDLCTCSILKSVFHSKKVPFSNKDFVLLCKFVLEIDKKRIQKSLNKLIELEFAEVKSNLVAESTPNVAVELSRLRGIPLFKRCDLNGFVVTGEDDKDLLNHKIAVFSGEYVSSYVYSRLEEEHIYYWYAPDFKTCTHLMDFLYDSKLMNQKIWYDNYPGDNMAGEEFMLQNQAASINASFVFSGMNVESAMDTKSIRVSLEEGALKKLLFSCYPREVAGMLIDCMDAIPNPDKKNAFVYEINKCVDEKGLEAAIGSFEDIFLRFDPDEDDETEIELDDPIEEPAEIEPEETVGTEVVTAITEKDFRMRYGYDESLYGDNSVTCAKISFIYKQLMLPSDYLRADESILEKAVNVIEQHPNIINKDVLISYLKNAVLFSKENVIRISPLLFVGEPGCGKTLLCRQLRECFGQTNDVFLPMGSGLGTDMLVGYATGYRNATNGQVLSSIWLSNDGKNCLNPILIIDELDKASFKNCNDVNQNVYPTLVQLLGDENMGHFKDNFFEVTLQNFYPTFFATANTLETIPEPLLDRFVIINFREYTQEEFKSLIIPLQYESFRKEHNSRVPERIDENDIDLLCKMSKGRTRQIQTSIHKFLAAQFDLTGQQHMLSSAEKEKLLEFPEVKQESIGFNF